MKRNSMIVTYLFMVLLAVFLLGPLVWIVMMSFKNPQDVIAVPPKLIFKPTLDNYLALFGFSRGGMVTAGMFLSSFKNTLIISAGSVLLSMIIGVPAAYAIARLSFSAKENFAFLYLSFRFVPEITIILPLYIIYQRINLYDNYIGMILIYQLISLPLIIWIMRSFFEEIPIEIEQAAYLDGYSRFQTMWRVIMPLAVGGIATASILAFIFCWNNFIFGLMLGSNNTQPITVGLLSFMGTSEVQWGMMAAATVIAIIPEIIMVISVQRYLIRGLTFGAVK